MRLATMGRRRWPRWQAGRGGRGTRSPRRSCFPRAKGAYLAGQRRSHWSLGSVRRCCLGVGWHLARRDQIIALWLSLLSFRSRGANATSSTSPSPTTNRGLPARAIILCRPIPLLANVTHPALRPAEDVEEPPHELLHRRTVRPICMNHPLQERRQTLER